MYKTPDAITIHQLETASVRSYFTIAGPAGRVPLSQPALDINVRCCLIDKLHAANLNEQIANRNDVFA
jgi:hypothetical protein